MVGALQLKIIDALVHNAHESRKRIAKRLGISESYLSKLITSLEGDGFIRGFTAEINYDAAEFRAHALTLIKLRNVSKDRLHDIAEKMSLINEAVEVYTSFGDWDIFVRWVCKTNADIMKNVDRAIDTTDIDRSLTIPLGHEYKRVRGPLLADTLAVESDQVVHGGGSLDG